MPTATTASACTIRSRLRFRIIENNNDTGFVEKLSNVGSEGTDILVKAMINIMLLNVFKEGASRKFKDFKLHCMMDEIGKLHPNNVNGILKFANDRNIILINGSPTELNRDAYKHVYLLTKGLRARRASPGSSPTRSCKQRAGSGKHELTTCYNQNENLR